MAIRLDSNGDTYFIENSIHTMWEEQGIMWSVGEYRKKINNNHETVDEKLK